MCPRLFTSKFEFIFLELCLLPGEEKGRRESGFVCGVVGSWVRGDPAMQA